MKEKISIYIVEDYVLSRMNLVCMLADKFNILGHFGTAESCIDAMREKQANIVIMDLGLPKMNGIEATNRLKLHFPDTKVVVFTSYENEEVVVAAISGGANAYCTKDINADSLITVLKLVNEGALWLDPKIANVASKILPKPNSTDFGNLYTNKKGTAILTERENEVLSLIVQGKSNPQIAKEFVISVNTAKAHVCHIIKKFSVTNRSEVIAKAIREGLI